MIGGIFTHMKFWTLQKRRATRGRSTCDKCLFLPSSAVTAEDSDPMNERCFKNNTKIHHFGFS